MKVSIIGSGHVGLVTGCCLAEKGHGVICVDVDQAKVERIERGESPIFERGLADLLKRNVPSRLKATTDITAAVVESDVSLITVGTPFDGEKTELGFVKAAARDIGRAMRGFDGYHAVVVKSTVPPGTTDSIVLPILEAESGKVAGRDFGVGMNPEFLREGEAVDDFMNPDRLVFGALDGRTFGILEELYRGFPDADRVRVSNVTAEMIKYASNSFFAMLISFSNEVGNLCAANEKVDVVDVLRSVQLDRRVRPILNDGQRLTPGLTNYLGAGCGYGGSCFPKDVRSLISHGRAAGVATPLLDAIVRVNDDQPGQVLRLLQKHFVSLAGVRITILGLAFKPGTDDMRESPAIPIVRDLRSHGAIVSAYDPAASAVARGYFDADDVLLCGDLEGSIEEAQAIVLVTRWPEFEQLPEMIAARSPQPLIVDGRRMLDKNSVERYEGIGL